MQRIFLRLLLGRTSHGRITFININFSPLRGPIAKTISILVVFYPFALPCVPPLCAPVAAPPNVTIALKNRIRFCFDQRWSKTAGRRHLSLERRKGVKKGGGREIRTEIRPAPCR